MSEQTRLTRQQFVNQERERIARNSDVDSVLTLEERDELIIEAFNEIPEGFIYDPEPVESWVKRLNRDRDESEKHSIEKILKSCANGLQPILTMEDPISWAWVTLGTGDGRRKPLWFITAFDLEAWVQRKRDAARRAGEAYRRAESEVQAPLTPILSRHAYFGAAMGAGDFSYAADVEGIA